jgi:hypothetical protein
MNFFWWWAAIDEGVVMSKSMMIVFVLVAIAVSSGCAVIDRTMLKPAAEASRVPPLVRSALCKEYKFSTGKKNALDPTGWNNPLFKNDCEGQEETVAESELLSEPCDGTNLKECAAFLERKSEAICSVHLSKIFGNRAVTNVTLGTLATATGIAGGIATGGAANALSGSAGFLTAGRSLFNEEIYRNYVAEAVIKEIVNNREASKAAIAEGVTLGEGSDVERNSVNAITGPQQVIQRVIEMHDQCSFYAGLTSLLGKAGKDDYAVNLKTGVAAHIEYLKGELAAVMAKRDLPTTDAKDKPALNATIDQLNGQISSHTLTLNLMAPGHVIDAPVGGSPLKTD